MSGHWLALSSVAALAGAGLVAQQRASGPPASGRASGPPASGSRAVDLDALLARRGAPRDLDGPGQSVVDLFAVERQRQDRVGTREQVPHQEVTTRFLAWPKGTVLRGRGGLSQIGGLLAVVPYAPELVVDGVVPWLRYTVELVDDGSRGSKPGRPFRVADAAPWLLDASLYEGSSFSPTYEARDPSGWKKISLRRLLPMRTYLVPAEPTELSERDAKKYAGALREHRYAEVRATLTKPEWQILLSYPTYLEMEADEGRWRSKTKKEPYELLNVYYREFGEASPPGLFQWTKKSDRLKLVEGRRAQGSRLR